MSLLTNLLEQERTESQHATRPWDFAPEWANWLVQDADGAWWFLEMEPRLDDFARLWGSWSDWLDGRDEYSHTSSAAHWQTSKQARPCAA